MTPEQRDVGVVFRNYALFPSMMAFEDIAFWLRAARQPRARIENAVWEIAETIWLSEYLRHVQH